MGLHLQHPVSIAKQATGRACMMISYHSSCPYMPFIGKLPEGCILAAALQEHLQSIAGRPIQRDVSMLDHLGA